ncbi:MAG: cobaltochelatase subunit CobN [Myxococcaceae bacterium]|nr:cobaltochelatase subunit CobN [Myxococcaceae bacterium]
MHVLATRPGGYAAGDGVVDLAQSPADIVILSAADTDLRLLADACETLPDTAPSLRLASLLSLRSNASVDLYFESVLQHAKLVVVSLIGGASYWPYGVEQLVERARDGKLQLVLVPGDDTRDPELERLSTPAAADCVRIWRFLREGGPDNASGLLRMLGARFFQQGEDPGPPRPLPRVAIYHPRRAVAELAFWQREWLADAPVVALLFYRTHLQAGNLQAFAELIALMQARGLNPLPISVASLKESVCNAAVQELLQRANAALIINTTGFAISSLESGGNGDGALGLGRPVLQAIVSGGNAEDWSAQLNGLSPSDLAMNVVLPEVDGRIITRAVSFKGLARRSERAEIDVAEYQLDSERASFVVELAARWAKLARTPVAERRIALVLANYPARDGRLGNGVGLDTPASTIAILRALSSAGYPVERVPEDGTALMKLLQVHVTNELDLIDTRPAQQSLSLEDYGAFLRTLPPELVSAVEQRWGPPERDPRVRMSASGPRIVVSGVQLGQTFVGIQPARGYEIDVASTYHDPDLVPPHGYLAFYAWLRRQYGAHALVHVGKHGSLEWLPGKSVALSNKCWPDAVFGALPHLYPFIVNDPGEGTQAKRRTQAVIIDHLVPPLTRAESYGPLRSLEQLVDEYYQALALDAPRALLLRREILALAKAAQLHRELGFVHLEGTRSDARKAELSPDDERFLISIDAYLCELKESQIRDGLHVFGRSPEGAQRLDTLVALTRLSTRRGSGQDEGLLRSISRALLGTQADGSVFDPLEVDFAQPWTGARPEPLLQISSEAWRTAGDTRERLELFARALLAGEVEVPEACRAVVERILSEVAPALDCCGQRELSGLLDGLDGRFVEPGPSGAPTRGRLDVLPTGRNFYSVDVRTVPTPSAFQLAQKSATRLVQRYVQDHGEYPRSIALSAWGTATMRTGGDDIAQALALLGVRPVWAEGSNRVLDTEILPVSVLRRPRVDVVLRISGFFRDAFPELIRLVDAAVRAVAALDEPETDNPIRARVEREERALQAAGVAQDEAARRARYRIFGSKPGAYGAGLQALIDQGAWSQRSELGEAFLDWGGYAYGANEAGAPAREALRTQLGQVDAVLQNQDNREHDILDSDDYYQFQGGLSAAVELTRGSVPPLYHGDHANPEAPRIRTLREELSRVFRSRVINPKWLAGVRRHGYKGAAEMAATVDFLFGYDAATDVVDDHQYALLSDAYLLDAENRAFLDEYNPSALREMTERLLEAMQRGMWQEPGAYRQALENVLLDAEEGT